MRGFPSRLHKRGRYVEMAMGTVGDQTVRDQIVGDEIEETEKQETK